MVITHQPDSDAIMNRIVYICCGVLLLMIGTTYGVNPLKRLTDRLPKLNAQIEKLTPCPEFLETPIMFNNLMLNQVGFNQYQFEGEIDIRETLDRPIILAIEMYKCRDKDEADCEYYFTFKKGGLCDMLDSNDRTWEYFTNGTDLPRTCPFPPKKYKINGASIDLKQLKMVPFFDSYWRFKNKMFMGEKLMFCLISEFTLKMKREF